MAKKRVTLYKFIQFLILVFTMALMLSKHYKFFEDIFSFFYESEFSIISVVFGLYSILHGLYMMFRAIKTKNIREGIEAVIVMVVGVILLSPEFNTIFYIPIISFFEEIHHEVISHLAFGLVPIIILYFIDMFRINKTD